MTFATVLIMNGYNPVMENLDTERVVWVVSAEDWDEGVEHLEEMYTRGACLVEPLRFMREIRDVRQRVYKLTGMTGKPRGTRVSQRRAPSA
jgi:hypothetical protein